MKTIWNKIKVFSIVVFNAITEAQKRRAQFYIKNHTSLD